MSWKTKTLKLTADQKKRGVIYSSKLIVTNCSDIKERLHEVFDEDPNKWEKIENLKDVSFFKSMAKNFSWDVVNEVRR